VNNSIIARLQSFKERFADCSDNFVLIGGAACSLIMEAESADFRLTKDVDIVLLVESLNPNFGRRLWDYVLEAGYEHRQASTGEPQFYRFRNPKSPRYPEMIELFSRRIDWLKLPETALVTPIPIGKDISSLSAILLNNDYYHFLRDGVRKIDGLPIPDELHLIPFKAKAWLELAERRNNGGRVDSADIRKHKRDIYRLCDLLAPGFKLKLPDIVDADLKRYIVAVQETLANLSAKDRKAEQSSLEKLAQLFGVPDSFLNRKAARTGDLAEAQKLADEYKAAYGSLAPNKSKETEI
jgi:hypothetical protein